MRFCEQSLFFFFVHVLDDKKFLAKRNLKKKDIWNMVYDTKFYIDPLDYYYVVVMFSGFFFINYFH